MLALPACASGNANQPPTDPSALSGPVNPVAVSDDDYAGKVQRLLVDGAPSQQRNDLLAGVVQYQLKRAAARFESGDAQAGIDAINGAFYLMRAGEARLDVLACCASSLGHAAREAARIGNEGRALALYQMLEQILPQGPEKRDVVEHLAAMRTFKSSTRSRGTMQARGADQRAAVQRSLVDARVKALNQARDRTLEWMQAALKSADGPIRSSFERDEAVEAYRAIRTGGAIIASLYLRHGDPRGALAALEHGDLARVVPPGLRDRLEAAADDDDPEAWADLFRLVDSAGESERPETTLDPDLARAAAWGSALGLYRSQPRSLGGTMPLSVMLVELGMAEAAPRLLTESVGEGSSAEQLSWSLSLVLRAIVSEDNVGDLKAARRVFAYSNALLDLARSQSFRGKVRPSAARLEYVMGALETRNGELERARPHMLRAVEEEPTLESLHTLAAIDRQQGRLDQSLKTLEAIVELAKKDADLASEGEALMMMFQIRRDQGQQQRAREDLDQALNRALDARELARTNSDQARAERLLARVLEHYGDKNAVRRATQRAYEASAADLNQFTATVIDASRRALTQRDLKGARAAVRHAVEAQLAAEDIVYVALWLKLLEQQLKVASDGTAEEAFAAIDDANGWPGKLRAWGRGQLDDTELKQSARGTIQLTEAKFYSAMVRHARGQKEAIAELKEVAESQAVELVEVTIARDLVAQRQGAIAASLPSDLTLP